jgi:translation initiation factor IF-2
MRSAPVPSSIVALALSLVGTLAVAETPPPAPVESAPPPAAPAPPAQLPPAPPPAAAPQAPLMAPCRLYTTDAADE